MFGRVTLHRWRRCARGDMVQLETISLRSPGRRGRIPHLVHVVGTSGQLEVLSV